MKNRLTILFLLIAVCKVTLLAQEPTLEELLLQLDEAVAQRDEIHQSKLKDLNKMKSTLEQTSTTSQYEIASKLMTAFKECSSDSAFYYANRMLETAEDSVEVQASKIHLAMLYTRRGEYSWAEHILVGIGKNIHESNIIIYYLAWDMLRTWQNEHLSPNNEIRNSSLWSYADSMHRHRRDPIEISADNAQSNIYRNPRAAIDTLRTIQDAIVKQSGWRFIGKRFGLCYQELGKRDSAEYYLALSALADMNGGIVEHTSLHLLSLMLMEDGEIERAYHYTKATMEDAILCGVRLRIEQVSRSMPKVLDSYYDELESRQRRINNVMYTLVFLLLVLSGALFYIYRFNKRLTLLRQKEKALNDALRHKEVELKESLDKQTGLVEDLSTSNKTKEFFVGQYMRQCVSNLQQLEHYRNSLQKVASQGNMDKLVTAIKKKDFIEKEMDSFYQGFDETFLHIFPHFVEDFNALLREECRIAVPEGKLLTVDLRIHALIRLGLTETEEIARFLHYSPQTIYNYRSRIRNSAISGKEDFEQKVREL